MTLQHSFAKATGLGLSLALGLGGGAALAQSMGQATETLRSQPPAPRLTPEQPTPVQPTPAGRSLPSRSLPFQSLGEATLDTTYRLGIGDVIDVSVFGAEEYSTQAIVLQDGAINLPRAGAVVVQGLTLREAEVAIATRYSTFLRQPLISVSPVNLRPVRIAISGEVKRPGSYIVQQSTDGRDNTFSDSRFPTLTEALSQAGGITARADISEVVLRRPVGYNQVQTSRFNLWDLIQAGDLSKDIVLQSGDEVFVPTVTALSPGDATALGSANFAPDTISVFVAGEAARPGPVQVPLNTSLNEVLLNAGGFDRRRANTSTVTLVRLAPDGTAVAQPIDVDFAQGLGTPNNPILNDRDMIVVDRSGLTTFGDTTNTLLSPFTQIINSIFGFRRLFE